MYRPLNLQQRLFLPYALALIFTSGGVWWGTVWMISDVLERRLDAQLQYASLMLTDFSLPLTKDLLLQIHRLLRADILLIKQDETVGISSLEDNSFAVADTILQEYVSWQHNRPQRSDSITFHNTEQSYKLALRALPPNRDARYTAVAVFSSLSDIESAKQQAALWIGSIVFFILLFLSWVGHRITISITRPIYRLADMARRIAAGERKIQVNVRRSDEIGVLSDTLNNMAAALSAYEAKLTDKSRLLALGQMTAQVAHEIRNPLTAIKLQLQLLNENLDGEQRTTTKQLLDEIQRLEFILSGLLEWGVTLYLNRSRVNFNQLVTEVIYILDAQMKHRHIELQAELDKDLPSARLDKNRIKQVIFNLLINACDALPNGGIIQLKTMHQNAQVTISIDDSGLGIAEDAIPLLFAQLSSTKSNRFGLGLPLCKKLIDLHQGQIKVSRSHLGGACFFVTLPCEEKTHV